jgi:hypothetical protein
MTGPRPPDDGPHWPEQDLPSEEQEEPSSWLESGSSFDAEEPGNPPDEPPTDQRSDRWWEMPWDRSADAARETPGADEEAEWPTYEPPAWSAPPPGPLEPSEPPAAEPPPGEVGGDPGAGDYRAPEPWPPVPPPSAAELPADEPAVDEPPTDRPPADEQPPQEPPYQPPSEPPAGEPSVDERPGDGPPPDEAPADDVAVGAAAATTTFAASDGWNPELDGERRRPTTAEQAVPWMIGVILALAGLLIVLLALIFTFPGGLTGSASPTPSPSLAASPQPTAVASEPAGSASSADPTGTPAPTPVPTPAPQYGPLEMTYLGRPSALAPIYLLRRDFSVEAEAKVMAQADQGISAYAWAPDGTVGAAIIASRAVALTPGQSARALADGVSAISFGWDAATLYAVGITRDGGNDVAKVLQVDFASGDTETLATITYPHPTTGSESKLKEAQFLDDGGSVRLYPAADGNLDLWVLGAPATYRIDPADGGVTNVAGQPLLYAPDGRQRIELTENSDGTTILRLLEPGDNEVASTKVTGLVSHIRWAGTGNEIVFTLGTLGSSGGVRQDLYVWDLTDGGSAMPLTSNGVSFGARWVGVMPNWLPAPS